MRRLAVIAVLVTATLVPLRPAGAAPTRTYLKGTVQVTGTYRPLVADFDANGRDEILWYAPGTGADVIWSPGSNGFTNKVAHPIVINGDWQVMADNFDPRTPGEEIYFHRPGASTDVLRGKRAADWTFDSRSIPNPLPASAIPLVGNWKWVVGEPNEGWLDIFWYVPGTGAEALWANDGDGTFTGVPVDAVNGTYEPAVLYGLNGPKGAIFWYAPGPAADSVWWPAGSAGWKKTSSPVSGDYTLTPLPDYGYTAVHFYNPRGSDQYRTWDYFTGVDPNASGTFNYGQQDGDYRPLRLERHPYACYCLMFWSPTQPEVSSFESGLIQGDVGAGVRPLMGEFWDSDADPRGSSDIFWYGPGSTPDQQWYGGFTS